jgi:hypothetical protein
MGTQYTAPVSFLQSLDSHVQEHLLICVARNIVKQLNQNEEAELYDVFRIDAGVIAELLCIAEEPVHMPEEEPAD